MKELVFKSAKGNPVTTSLLVAIKFGKEHRHVLDAIRNLITTAENSAVLSMFYETTYLNSQNKNQPMYIMTRNGFSFLVLGYTGPKAGQWKEKFISSRQIA
jgi:anti-repressor protein